MALPLKPDPEWLAGLKEGDEVDVFCAGKFSTVAEVVHVGDTYLQIRPGGIFSRATGYEQHPSMGGSRYLVAPEAL